MASRVRHAVFVKEGAEAPARIVDEIPEQLATRLISFRAFDHDGMMTNADVVEGNGLKPMIFRDACRRAVDCLHPDNANYGRFAARIDRA